MKLELSSDDLARDGERKLLELRYRLLFHLSQPGARSGDHLGKLGRPLELTLAQAFLARLRPDAFGLRFGLPADLVGLVPRLVDDDLGLAAGLGDLADDDGSAFDAGLGEVGVGRNIAHSAALDDLA